MQISRSSLILYLISQVASWNLNCNSNVVYYWGQNSYGAAHPNEPKEWEKDLDEYCNDSTADVINLSFLNVFNAGTDLPEVNFANHCETLFPPPANKLRTCPIIGKSIKYCQSKGKTMLLSLGGAIASTGFSSQDAASAFADMLWNMFMEGTHEYRPFEDALIDGIDLDLEGGSQAHYDIFLAKLQNHFKSSSRKYYVTAAPQCEFPDRNLQTIMELGHMDAIFIQFYNNWCGVQNYGNQWAWNWPTWSTWAKTKSFNKNVKLYLGVPAARTAAGSGYIGMSGLDPIINDLRKDPVFGGVMLWDASQSEHNLVEGKAFGSAIKKFLLGNSNCPSEPPTTTTTSSSSTTTSSTTSSSSTTTSSTASSSSATSISTTSTSSSSSSTTSTSSSSSSSSSTTSSSTSSDKPQPTNTCPVTGDPCSGGTACSGTKYAVCSYGRWIVRNCGEGTVCAVKNNEAYCDFPGNNPPPPCTSQLNLQYVDTKKLVLSSPPSLKFMGLPF